MPQQRAFQFGMRSVLLAVALAASFFAAYRIDNLKPMVPYYLLLAVCIVATSGVIHETGRRQAFWLGIDLVCLAHFLGSFHPGPVAPLLDWEWWRNSGIYLVLQHFAASGLGSSVDRLADLLALPTWLLIMFLLSLAGGIVSVWAYNRFHN